jgi:hypothetical protein
MKSITYARLTLLTPYPIIIVSILGFISSYYHLKAGYFPNIVEIISGLILYSAVLWFVPYTILAIGLLVWSIRKSFKQFKIAYIGSPIFFAVIFLLYFVVTGITGFTNMGEIGSINTIEMAIALLVTLGISIPMSVTIGYLLVGLSLLFYNLLFNLKVIRD